MEKKFIPALKFKPLNRLFDPFLKLFMKEDRIKAEFIAISGVADGTAVLDFGCGTGTLLGMIRTRFPDALLTGVDIDEEILNLAEEKLSGKAVELVRYDGVTLPFSVHSFDTVVSSLTVHHLGEEKLKPFREILRVLKPGGAFFILDLAPPCDVWSRLITAVLGQLEPIEDNIRGHLPGLLSESGFSTVAQTGYYRTAFGALTIYSGLKGD